FGDYFKAEAIAFAWELLTRDFGLDKSRLRATVFTDDDDAFALWKTVAGLGDDRVLRLGEKDNFWAMGDTGPCGPCSEVHFHQGDHLPCAEEAAGRTCLGPACECDRWLEIWNLVFMQFNAWRGYVLRRIMRRAMRHGRRLGLTEPFLYRSVEWVVALMGQAYPEIAREQARVQDTVRGEEERFAETLDSGMRRIEEYF